MSSDKDRSERASTLAAATVSATHSTARYAKSLPDDTKDKDKGKDTRSRAELKADALRNREELAATLDAIEYRINVPKRVSNRIRVLREENPAALAAIGVAAVAVVGVAAFFGVRSLFNR